MNSDNNTIHVFDIQLIGDYFANMARQGPGSTEATLKALSFIPSLTRHSQIADLGCGTGEQTRVLAQHAPGNYTGIDIFPKFINLFNQEARQAGLDTRVKGITGDMAKLPFKKESLDLIWSEGAIYNIGFERGLHEWRALLKASGYLAVSEASWFTNERPAEIEQFWLDAYPEMDTIAHKVAQMHEAGYIPVATFVLPDNCWLKNFYEPQVAAQKIFLEKYSGNKTAQALVANERREAALYNKYKAYYGYVFYIGKKI